jgi:hypothetical protein
VDDKIKKSIPLIISKLESADIHVKSAFLGFDACIDHIIRIVREKAENGETEFFSTSEQFGNFLINLDNKSCGVELQTKLSKIGGNMVIMANALGNLGVKVESVGTYGFPEILPVFRTMSANCSLHTIGETISANALEFDRSKVIMFDPGPYNHLKWEDIKRIVGLERLREMVAGKQLISFVNWSEIENSSEIWKGFLDEVFTLTEIPVVKPFFFTDFSDCSRKSKQDIQVAVSLLARFRKHFRVHLSLNQNEAALVAKALEVDVNTSDTEFIKSLYTVSNSDVLIIHRVNDALAFDGVSLEQCDTFLCNDPVILTGGGDNFNAGFCYSLFFGLSLLQSLIVANAVSGSYVKSGVSPDSEQLKLFILGSQDGKN